MISKKKLNSGLLCDRDWIVLSELAIDNMRVIMNFHESFNSWEDGLDSQDFFQLIVSFILNAFAGFTYPLREPTLSFQDSQFDRFEDYAGRWMNQCFSDDILIHIDEGYRVREMRELSLYSNILRSCPDYTNLYARLSQFIKFHLASRISVSNQLKKFFIHNSMYPSTDI